MLLGTCLGTGEATLAPRCPSCMNPQPRNAALQKASPMAISGPSTPTSPVAQVAQGSCGLKSIPNAYLGQVPDHGLHEA